MGRKVLLPKLALSQVAVERVNSHEHECATLAQKKQGKMCGPAYIFSRAVAAQCGMTERRDIFLKEHRIHAGEMRRGKKYTQVEVAQALGVDHSTVGRIETGAMPYYEQYLIDFAAFCKVTVRDLFYLPGMAPKDIDADVAMFEQLPDAEKQTVRAMIQGLIGTKTASR